MRLSTARTACSTQTRTALHTAPHAPDGGRSSAWCRRAGGAHAGGDNRDSGPARSHRAGAGRSRGEPASDRVHGRGGVGRRRARSRRLADWPWRVWRHQTPSDHGPPEHRPLPHLPPLHRRHDGSPASPHRRGFRVPASVPQAADRAPRPECYERRVRPIGAVRPSPRSQHHDRYPWPAIGRGT